MLPEGPAMLRGPGTPANGVTPVPNASIAYSEAIEAACALAAARTEASLESTDCAASAAVAKARIDVSLESTESSVAVPLARARIDVSLESTDCAVSAAVAKARIDASLLFTTVVRS